MKTKLVSEELVKMSVFSVRFILACRMYMAKSCCSLFMNGCPFLNSTIPGLGGTSTPETNDNCFFSGHTYDWDLVEQCV